MKKYSFISGIVGTVFSGAMLFLLINAISENELLSIIIVLSILLIYFFVTRGFAIQCSEHTSAMPILDNRITELEALLHDEKQAKQAAENECAHLLQELERAQRAERYDIRIAADSIRRNSPFANTVVYEKLLYAITNLDDERVLKAMSENIRISPPIHISASMFSSSGNEYQTSLDSCTCVDFQMRKQPCKHMIRLAIDCGILFYYDFSKKKSLLSQLLNQNIKNEALLSKIEGKAQDLKKLLAEKKQAFPWLANMYEELEYSKDKYLEYSLSHKQHPALKAADAVSQIASEKRKLISKCKQLEYQINYYESVFPWLEDFKELPPIAAWEDLQDSDTASDEYATLTRWISPTEYSKNAAPKNTSLRLTVIYPASVPLGRLA